MVLSRTACLSVALAFVAAAQQSPLSIPPRGTAPGCVRLYEPALTSRNFYQLCGPTSATADVTLINGAKWDGALTGGTSSDNYVASRSVNVFDMNGGTGSFTLRSDISVSTDSLTLTSGGGTALLALSRSVANSALNSAVFTSNAIPNGTYTLGNIAAPWNYGYVNNLAILGITGSTQCLQANSAGAVSGTGAACGGGGSTLPVVDTTSISKGSVDASKTLRFEVDGFTSGATRVLTPMDADYQIAANNLGQTFTGTQTFSSATIHSAGIQTGGDILATASSLDLGSTTTPFDRSYLNTSYTKDFRACYPSGFGTCWTLIVPGGAGDYFDIRDQGGVTFLRLDTAGAYAELKGLLRPSANNTYDLGTSALKFRDIYFAGTLYGGQIGSVATGFGAVISGSKLSVTDGTFEKFRASNASILGQNSSGTQKWIISNDFGSADLVSLRLTGSTGSGNANVCINASGDLYRGSPGC